MPRKSQKGIVLNKKAVFDAASMIAQSGKMPTIKDIRAQLGSSGSETTIHKYLSQWKKELLKIAAKMEDYNAIDLKTRIGWLDEKNALEQTLTSQKTQNKILVAELIKSEKEAVNLKDQIEILQKNLKGITERYQTLTLKYEHLEKLCQEIKEERKVLCDEIMNDKNKQIATLQQELREINKDSLDQIKTMGFEGDDALMREKVKIIHLEDKLSLLTEQMKVLEAELKTTKEANEPLAQQVNKQKEFIQKIVTWEQLQDYEKVLNKG